MDFNYTIYHCAGSVKKKEPYRGVAGRMGWVIDSRRFPIYDFIVTNNLVVCNPVNSDRKEARELDVTTMANLFTPDMVETASDMLQLAIMCCDKPPKTIAVEIGYSVDSIYAAVKGIRNIPTQARQKLAGVNVIAAAAVALEATGFKRLFGYQKVDRHIQSMILRLRTRDKETDRLLDEMPVLLLDKNSPDDLSNEELQWLTDTACKIADLANGHINLIMELEVKYKLGITDYLQGNKKSPAA